MKNNIHYSPEALNDLDGIWDYIASELFNPSAAEHTVTNITDSIDRLEDFPELGALLSSVTKLESDYLFLVSGNYLVFYRVDFQNVYIDRILYSKRDYLHILFSDLA